MRAESQATCGREKRLQLLAIAVSTATAILIVSIGVHAVIGDWSRAPVTRLLAPTAALASDAKASLAPAATRYTCPMHPHYISDAMGTCPICGMNLVKLAGEPPVAPQAAGDGKTTAAPMSADDSTRGVEKRTVITVPPETIQNMGVRLGRAERTIFGRQIRSFEIVRENERAQSEITARVEGWVENLKVTAVGDEVQQGDLLFELYSPQLIISQNDYLRSRENQDLSHRAEGQLRAFGFQPKALDSLRNQKRPMERVPFYAETGGTIAELALRQGTYVKRGMMLAKIQDYSTVWLMVGVAEKDLAFVTRDTPAAVTFPNLPGRRVQGKVDHVYPTIDSKTRTGQVRLVIDNDDLQIRPGSYADVTFEVGAKHRLAVPSDAILMSGSGRYVVVALEAGRFEPRAVETGLSVSGRTEIASGLEAGEQIVVSGQFLLDSESALRETFRKLEKLKTPLGELRLSKGEFSLIDHVIDAALYIHENLVADSELQPEQLGPAIASKDRLWPKFRDTQLAYVLGDASLALKRAQIATTASELRIALARLAEALRPWVTEGASDYYADKKLVLFREAETDRLWLQLGTAPANPYGEGASKRVAYGPGPPSLSAVASGSDRDRN